MLLDRSESSWRTHHAGFSTGWILLGICKQGCRSKQRVALLVLQERIKAKGTQVDGGTPYIIHDQQLPRKVAWRDVNEGRLR